MRCVVLPPAILGILAIAVLSDPSQQAPRSGSSKSHLSGAPVLPETCGAPAATPLGPCLTDEPAVSAERVLATVLGASAPSEVDHHPFLIDAQVLEKYRSFRESLTSP